MSLQVPRPWKRSRLAMSLKAGWMSCGRGRLMPFNVEAELPTSACTVSLLTWAQHLGNRAKPKLCTPPTACSGQLANLVNSGG